MEGCEPYNRWRILLRRRFNGLNTKFVGAKNSSHHVNTNSSGQQITSKFCICSMHLPVSICYKCTNSNSGFITIISTISSNLYYLIWTMTTCFGYNFPLSFQLPSFLIPYVLNIRHKQPSQINIFLNKNMFIRSLKLLTWMLVHKYVGY